MIIDELGLPKDNGATDFQDSARLAGIMQIFGWILPIEQYVIQKNGKTIYARHPLEDKYDFSRDQAVCLVAGLWKANKIDLVNESYVTGRDIFSPSVKGHFKRCKNMQANWFQNLWLKFDILWHSYVTPLDEPNQLICMMMVAGPDYIKMWKKHNKQWQKSIKDYWCGWRNEQYLASEMIKQLEKY